MAGDEAGEGAGMPVWVREEDGQQPEERETARL